MTNHSQATPAPIVPPENRFAFLLIATCFGLWGMVNMMNDTLVPAVQKIFSIDNSASALVQVVNYAAYALLALPAAILIKRFNYKIGVLLGLVLLTIGVSSIVPAGISHVYTPILIAIAMMACGNSVLETSCNPYVLSMGSEESAVRRLNLAQTVNPIGCLLGLVIAKYLILANLNPAEAAERKLWSADKAHEVLTHELFWLAIPYGAMVLVTVAMVIFLLTRRMPEGRDTEHSPHILLSIRRLISNQRYVLGVLTQFFYVALQVAVWTFIIKYTREAAIFTVDGGGKLSPGLTEADAWYSLAASMVVFSLARIGCTALMRRLNPASMMATLSVVGIALTAGAIMLPSWAGVVSLVLVSACMSLMFPTIYGIALRDLGPEVKLGASGLIMAIIGGAAGSYSQGYLIDMFEKSGHRVDLAIRYSFIVPIACLVVVLLYALKYRSFCATAPATNAPVGSH
jgi:FHS family L-fucose permease-like MFS transporter